MRDAGAGFAAARGGLSPEDVSALVLPAIGPKWLVLYGIDSALVRAGFLEAAARARRLLLFGASAGAWRGLALAARDPARAIDALRDLYCEQHFTTQDSPAAISGAYRRLLRSVLTPEDLAHVAAHPELDLAIATVRARGLLALRPQKARASRVAGSGGVAQRARASHAAHVLRARGVQHGRSMRCSGRTRRGAGAHGREHAEAALASGTVPLYMQSVRDIPSAPQGMYMDGGFSDYHLNRQASGRRHHAVVSASASHHPYLD